MKKVNPEKTIYTLVKEDAAIIPILVACGFDKITKKGMIETVGRLMTLSQGMTLRKIDQTMVKETFLAHGYIWEENHE
ncbi:MAG: DUF1858 domain-containing protein [Candidatus Izemoplasmataceae bacterium]